MVCLTRGGFELYLYYFRVGTELSVGCTQVRRLCLSFMPRESIRCRQVGPAGLPYAGRLGDAAIWPPPLRGRSWFPPEVGGGCVAPTKVVRGRPASPRPAGLALARFGPPSLWHIVHKMRTAPQVSLGLDALVCYWNWAHLNLVQALRSQLVNFAWTTLELASSCAQDHEPHNCKIKSHSGRPAGRPGLGRPAWDSSHFGSIS